MAGPIDDGELLLARLARSDLDALGDSREGRSIVGRVIAGHAQSRASEDANATACRLLVVGGVHGDEPTSVAAVLELVERLGPAPSRWEALVIVPALNPDGLHTGVKNARSDVDLNRNFPARNFTRAHSPGYDPGPFPLSEPECALLARLCHHHRIDAAVAVHAPLCCVNFDGPARAWANAVANASGWPVREDIGYPTPGSLGSWLGVDHGLPVLTVELPPGPLAGFRTAAAAALDAAIGHPPRASRTRSP
jgi:murein peptide amidase A